MRPELAVLPAPCAARARALPAPSAPASRRCRIGASFSLPSAADSSSQSSVCRRPVRSSGCRPRRPSRAGASRAACAPISIEKTTTGSFVVQRDVLGDVQRERGLAHARPPGDDDEVARLQPRGHLVEVGEAGRHAGDRRTDRRGCTARRCARPRRSAASPSSAYCFCPRAPCSAICRILVSASSRSCARAAAERVVRRVGDLAGDRGELAQDRALANDLRVAPDVGRRRHALRPARRGRRGRRRSRASASMPSASATVTDVGGLAVADQPQRRAAR